LNHFVFCCIGFGESQVSFNCSVEKNWLLTYVPNSASIGGQV
jgi:hypothetical protein